MGHHKKQQSDAAVRTCPRCHVDRLRPVTVMRRYDSRDWYLCGECGHIVTEHRAMEAASDGSRRSGTD